MHSRLAMITALALAVMAGLLMLSASTITASTPQTPEIGPAADISTRAPLGLAVAIGSGWTTPLNISSNSGESASPMLGLAQDGQLYMTWYDSTQFGNWEVLYAARSPAGDWSLDNNLSNNASFSMIPAIATGADGAVHVAWQDYGPPRVAFQGTLLYRARPAGEDFEPSQGISATAGFGAYPEVRDPSLVVDSRNTLHLVWAGFGPSSYDIFYASKPAGGAWSFPKDIYQDAGDSLYPRLAVDQAGTVHMVWQETPAAATQADIYYSYLPSGGVWSLPIDLSHNAGDSGRPALEAGADGSLFVVWQDGSVSPNQSEILATEKLPGQPWGAPVNISRTAGDSAGPALAVDAAGTLHVTWYDNTPDNWDILYASKPRLGDWTHAANISNTPGRSSRPSLLYDRGGKLYLAWQDQTPGNFDTYFSIRDVPVFGTSYKAATAAVVDGDTIAYSIHIRNLGPAPLPLTLTDTLPAGVTFVPGSLSASSGTASYAGGAVLWSGLVFTGNEERVRFRAALDGGAVAGSEIHNQALISDGSNTVEVDAHTTVYAARLHLPIIVSARSPGSPGSPGSP